MPNTTLNWQVWNKRIDAYIEDELDLLPKSVYETLVRPTGMTDKEMQDMTYSGFGPIPEVGESGNSVESSPLEGFLTIYQLREYRMHAEFSSTMIETDRHDTVEELSRSFARTPNYTRNLNFFGLLRNAFDATATGGDGRSLISLLHPRKDGAGTQPNTFVDGIQRSLDYASVELIANVMDDVVANNGNLLEVAATGRNKLLVTTPKNKIKAFQIAGVDGPDFEPDSAENNVNFFRKGDNYDVLITDFLSWNAASQAGDTTVAKTSSSNIWDSMWFVIDVELSFRYFKFFFMDGYPKFEQEYDLANGNLIKYVGDKFMYGWSNWFHIAGSQGNNSTMTT